MSNNENTGKKQNYEQGVTPRGRALWCKIDARKPDMYEGKEIGLTAQIVLEAEDAMPLMQAIDAAFDRYKDAELKGKKVAKGSIVKVPYVENEDGTVTFKFKTKHKIPGREGADALKVLPVFDTKGKPTQTKIIGNNSIIKVAYAVNPYYVASNNYGVSLYLNAIQLIELVEYNGNTASGFGFGEEEGSFSAEDKNDSSNPFSSEEGAGEEEEEEGDF